MAANAFVDAPHPAGATPLQTASERGHADAVTALLAHGADILGHDAVRRHCHRPAYIGHLSHHHASRIDAHAHLASRSAPRRAPQVTPLHLAAKNGHALVASALIGAGSDVDAPRHPDGAVINDKARDYSLNRCGIGCRRGLSTWQARRRSTWRRRRATRQSSSC